MKKRFSLILLLSWVLASVAVAQGRMSALTRLAVSPDRSLGQHAKAHDEERVRAFITVDSPPAIDSLRQMGVSVQCRFDGMITASVPLRQIPALCRLAGVRQVSVAQIAEACNDSSRIDSHVQLLVDGEGFPMPYTGKGVIVGVIDSGVDFNHINLCDEYGRSRVVAAYLPQDSTGVAPIIEGDTLPGSHYDTPEQIALLTTDAETMSHGTHTTGTAAGSYRGNSLQGMAPEAQLVICAMPLLYDTDIANSVKYIFNYASRKGLPAVINMSFSSLDGPHDGTSPLCRIFDEQSDAGRLLVISANNSGFANTHLQYRFKSTTDTLSTMFELYSSNAFSPTASLWSSKGHRHKVALTLTDRTSKEQLLQTPFFSDLSPDSVLTLDLSADTLWCQYASGTIQLATAVEDGDRSHSVILCRLKPLQPSRYRLGLKVVSDSDPAFHAWVSGSNYFRALLSGQTGGTKAGTINDLATGDEAISVGAYITKQGFPQATGGFCESPRAKPLHDLAYFTSWGPDARGIARPDICAPGMVTVSSVSRFDSVSSLVNSTNLSVIERVDGIDYPYGACYGTSMSAPVVTGTLALWLQAHPMLTADDVRNILENTALRDSFVIIGDVRGWGRGKLDAAAGMRYLLRMNRTMDVNGDGWIDVADINTIINVILNFETDSIIRQRADVNADGIVDVADINLIINNILAQ